jgi:hypothetical protein
MNAKTWKLWRRMTGFVIGALLLSACAQAQDLVPTAHQALGGEAGAVASLRAAGPSGLEALLALGAAEPAAAASGRYHDLLDSVCAQKDCAASHLYWYTDLAAAREAAQRSGRPILSLRLLGRLDEELSCANSRFFRTALYADPAVSRLLRERFVLHWQSERPVPKVTIDYGDGRSLVGTVTGNSIHYVLDRRGRLVDALPGLYGSAAFQRLLREAATQASRMAELADADFAPVLADYHRQRLAARDEAIAADFRKAGFRQPALAAQTALRLAGAERDQGVSRPSAVRASDLTMSKSAVEMPLLLAVLPGFGRQTAKLAELSAIVEIHQADAILAEASRRLLIAKAGAWLEDDSDRALARFQSSIAEDTVSNEYLLHGEIHSWLADAEGFTDLAAFDARVYSQLFLTPASDPWLGLGPKEIFAVLTPPAER